MTRVKPVTYELHAAINLEPKLLTPVLLIKNNTFTLRSERLSKCPRAASIISNHPWDLSSIERTPAPCAYFEVTFSKLNNKEGKVSVGIGNQIFVQNQMLGYQQNSIGYCSDGIVSQNSFENIQHLSMYSEGAIVGVGILCDSYNQRRIFFTLNGTLVGTFYERIHIGMDCFPGVSFTKGSEVEFTVNMIGPFKFNVNSLPDHRQHTTDNISALPHEVLLNCLFLASTSACQTLEFRLVSNYVT